MAVSTTPTTSAIEGPLPTLTSEMPYWSRRVVFFQTPRVVAQLFNAEHMLKRAELGYRLHFAAGED